MLLWLFLNAWEKSVIKDFLYNCLSELSYTTVSPNSRYPPPKAMTTFIVFRLLALRCKFIIYENLLLFVIFSASLSGSDDFVLFDSPDGNGAYSQMFYAIFQFCAQVKFATLDGKPANVKMLSYIVRYKVTILNIVTLWVIKSKLCETVAFVRFKVTFWGK